MLTDGKKIINGSIIRILNFGINLILTFFLMPFIIHSLGDRMYGLWTIVGSFLGFYWLMDLGMGSAIQRYVSRAFAVEDYKEANSLINTALALFSILGIGVVIFSIIAAYTASFFTKNIADLNLFKHIIIILGVSFGIRLPMRVFVSVLMAHLRYDLCTISTLARLLLRTALIVYFLKAGYGVLALAYITFFSDLLEYALTFLYAKKSAGYMKLSKSFVEKSKIKPLFNYSISTFIAQIVDTMRFNIDNFIVAAFLGLNSVTLYSIAVRLITYFIDFMFSGVGVMLPVFSKYESKNDYDSIREKFVIVTKISGYIAILIGGIIVVMGRPFILRWLGESYITAYENLLILLAPAVFMYLSGPVVDLLRGISKHGIHAAASVLEVVTHIVLGILLVNKLGLPGVAVGAAVPLLIVRSFILPAYACKIIKLKYHNYLFGVVGPVLFKSVLISAFCWFLFKGLIAPDYARLFLAAGCYSGVYAAVVYLIGFSKQERRLILAQFIR